MRAVNLVPADQRRQRGGSGGGGIRINPESFGPAHLVVAILVIVIALVALRVLAGNDVNDRKATLAAVQGQVATEQAEASRLGVYTGFVQAAQQREDQVREIAEQRFPWQRTLDQISRVMPATTSLSSLTASTAASTTTAGAIASGPSFTLNGCADTPNQNGTATLLRRLTLLSGVSNVGFQSSTRQAGCGNSFSLGLNFAAVGTDASSSSTGSVGNSAAVATAPTTTAQTTTTAATATATATTPATTATTEATAG